MSALAVRAMAGDAGGGIHARAALQIGTAGNYPSHTCKPQTVEWLKVFPPDQTVAVYVSHSFSACAAMGTPLLFVMPVRTGLGVRGVQP